MRALTGTSAEEANAGAITTPPALSPGDGLLPVLQVPTVPDSANLTRHICCPRSAFATGTRDPTSEDCPVKPDIRLNCPRDDGTGRNYGGVASLYVPGNIVSGLGPTGVFLTSLLDLFPRWDPVPGVEVGIAVFAAGNLGGGCPPNTPMVFTDDAQGGFVCFAGSEDGTPLPISLDTWYPVATLWIGNQGGTDYWANYVFHDGLWKKLDTRTGADHAAGQDHGAEAAGLSETIDAIIANDQLLGSPGGGWEQIASGKHVAYLIDNQNQSSLLGDCTVTLLQGSEVAQLPLPPRGGLGFPVTPLPGNSFHDRCGPELSAP